MAVLIPILIVVLALDVFCFVDLYRAEESRNLPKWAWTIMIILIHFFGAIAYLFFGRKRHAGLGLT
jgi:predicted membrane-bound dolichyl-phosphate-mannose-protein mannosyltransferase